MVTWRDYAKIKIWHVNSRMNAVIGYVIGVKGALPSDAVNGSSVTVIRSEIRDS